MNEKNNFNDESLTPIGTFPNSSINVNKDIIGIKELIKQSWELFKNKFLKIVAILLIPAFFSFVNHLLVYSDLESSLFKSVLEFISLIIYLFAWAIILSSAIYIISGDFRISEALKKGIKTCPHFIILYLMYILIITGGSLLLIIPGLIFIIWFNFSFFLLVLGKSKGFNALFQSKKLVEGYFWKIVGRYLMLFLVIIIPAIIITAPFTLVKQLDISTLADLVYEFIIYIFISNFILCYTFLLFKNIFEIKPDVNTEETKRSFKITFSILGLIGAPLILLMMFFNLLYIFSYDEPPFNDPSLDPSNIIYSENENAFNDFKNISENIYYPKEKGEIIKNMSEGEEWDESLAEELVSKNSQAFEYMYGSLTKKGYQDPVLQLDLTSMSANTVLTSTSDFRVMAQLAAIKAQVLFNSGNQEEAFNEALNIMKFGQLLHQGDRSNLIQYLIGVSVKNTALNLLVEFTQETNITSDKLSNFRNSLDDFESRKALKESYKMEAVWMKNETNRLAIISRENKTVIDPDLFQEQSGVPLTKNFIEHSNFYFKPNQTNRLFAEHWMNHIKAVDSGCQNFHSFTPSYVVKLPSIIFTENAIGKVLSNISAVSIFNAINKNCELEFRILQIQTMMATKAYMNDIGNFPESLDKLYPNYLNPLPEIYLGSKIIYNNQKGTIILESDSQCNEEYKNPVYCE